MANRKQDGTPANNSPNGRSNGNVARANSGAGTLVSGPCEICKKTDAGCRKLRTMCYCNAPPNEAPDGWERIGKTDASGDATAYRARRSLPTTSANRNSIPVLKDPIGPESNSQSSSAVDPTIRIRDTWRAVPITELGPSEPTAWLWEGIAARGAVSLLTGFWKSGKTTIYAHALRAMATGGTVATKIAAGRALIVSEESPSAWRSRRDKLGIGSHVAVICRPFRGRASWDQWQEFVRYLATLVRDRNFDLVVLDPVSNLWPLRDENDASTMQAALLPLHEITETGAALVLVHHARKGDGTEGQAARGSGALSGFVDVIVEFRRENPRDEKSTRRILTCLSRYDNAPAGLVVELGDDGYRTIGERRDVHREDRLTAITAALPKQAPGVTAEELRKRMLQKDSDAPALKVIRELLSDAPGVSTSGQGVKNDPRRYWRGDAHCGPARASDHDQQVAGITT